MWHKKKGQEEIEKRNAKRSRYQQKLKSLKVAVVANFRLSTCDPDWIQTNDLLLRRQLLYSTELPGHTCKRICKAANINNPYLRAEANPWAFYIVLMFLFR